jgi:hypothetical protein
VQLAPLPHELGPAHPFPPHCPYKVWAAPPDPRVVVTLVKVVAVVLADVVKTSVVDLVEVDVVDLADVDVVLDTRLDVLVGSGVHITLDDVLEEDVTGELVRTLVTAVLVPTIAAEVVLGTVFSA